MDHFCCLFRVCLVFVSVHCSLIFTSWERADLLALLFVMLIVFCHFSFWCHVLGVVLDCIDS